MRGAVTHLTPFWFVWSPAGFPPRHRHATRQAAEDEAQRLALAAPGHEFLVLAPVSRISCSVISVDRYWSQETGAPY
jgi:hypothetical protein